ncbi:hypothetical protein AB1Y20_021887 [Prymnesium parvum]|uniref:SET domain-containing protein n=1 Tax=Prymnesium parvum TaxID=97485 RepID=A0AB34JF90_PRYPA
MASPCAQPQLPHFTAWLRESGAHLSPKLEFFCSAAGRGIRAVEPLDAGEVAASVPLKLLVTTDRALADEELRASTLRGTNLMALFLLRQRAPGQPWYPYVDALPRTLGTPIFWSNELRAELQSTELASLTRAREAAVAKHYDALSANFLAASSLDDFKWALSIVWSRGHTVDIPGGDGQGALIPLIDMFNHHLEPAVRAGSVEGEAFVLRVGRRLERGHEATVPYGAHGPLPNSRLLMEYGFCERSNSAEDYLTLHLNASRAIAPHEDPHRWLRAGALSQLALSPQENFAVRIGLQATTLPPIALAFARLSTLKEKQVLEEAIGVASADPQLRSHWLSRLVRGALEDEASLRFLAEALRWKLRNYTTSAEHDELLLHRKVFSGEEMECALLVRLAEKRAIGRWLSETQASVSGLQHEEL